MAPLNPVDIVDNGDVSMRPRSPSTVLARLTMVSLKSLFCREEFDVIAQCALIAFEGNVVGLLVQDLLTMVRRHPIASIVTMAPSMASMSSSLGIAIHWPCRHLDLPQHQTLAGGEGGNHVYRLLGIPGALGAADRLAVYGDDAFRRARQ